MQTFNPYSEDDLLPIKYRMGKYNGRQPNEPIPLEESTIKPIDLNLKKSSAHEQVHELLKGQKKPKTNRFGQDLTKGLIAGLTAFDAIIPGDDIQEPVVRPEDSTPLMSTYGKGSQAIAKNGMVIPGLNGTMYSRGAYKSKTKVTNKMLADYGATIGGEDPVTPSLKKNVYTSYDQIDKDNKFVKDFLQRHNASKWDVENTVVARNIGDTVPQFVYPQGQILKDTKPLPTKLPNGVSIDKVYRTSEGLYGYNDPREDYFVPVDPSVYNAYNKKTASKMKQGGKLKAKGGISLPSYEEGGSYDLTNKQIQDLLSQGYELEI